MTGRIDSLVPPLHSDLFGVYGACHISEKSLTFYFKVAKDLSQKISVDHKPLGRAISTFWEITLK